MRESLSIPQIVERLVKLYAPGRVSSEAIWRAFRVSLSAEALVNALAEAARSSPSEVEANLNALGLTDIILRDRKAARPEHQGGANRLPGLPVLDEGRPKNPFPELFRVVFTPSLSDPIPLAADEKDLLSKIFNNALGTFEHDSFQESYRRGVPAYFQHFMSNVAPQMSDYVQTSFPHGQLKYMVTTGIGANELYSHLPASINNQQPDRRLTWIVINSTTQLLDALPSDAGTDNTLFLEFSRSSVTEETVKLHEYTPRGLHRMVFSNAGPLRDLAMRDKNLLLELPDQVSGRFGRNKTPILLAPMYLAGMDVDAYWRHISRSVDAFDLSSSTSLPVLLAKFLLMHQRHKRRNLVYLTSNDAKLGLIADELVQLWDEGVNKAGSDFFLARGFGLPRDSHSVLEGILGNKETKLCLFLLRSNMRCSSLPPLVHRHIDPINPQHKGLQIGDEEVILSMANYRRCSEVMPTILIEILGEPSLTHDAVLGQLFADMTYVYSRFAGVDPGSNPEVKAVRERSARLLAQAAAGIQSGLGIEDVAFDSV